MGAAGRTGRRLAAMCLSAGFVACVAAPAALSSPASTMRAPAVMLAQADKRAPKTIVFRENEVRGKTVATEADGLLQLLFADGTALTLGPSSQVTIDAFVFDPANDRATIAATLTRGVFRFIGGRTSKTPQGVTFTTPFGVLTIDAAGSDMNLGEGDVPAHFEMVFGGGSIALTRGGAVLGRVYKRGYSIVPQANGGGAAVRKTPEDWRAALQKLLSERESSGLFPAALRSPCGGNPLILAETCAGFGADERSTLALTLLLYAQQHRNPELWRPQ